MANPNHVALVKSGRIAFNDWRRQSYGSAIDLAEADLAGADLSGMNLEGADLRGARLCLGPPVEDSEDFSGDPPGRPGAFLRGPDRITTLRIERGEPSVGYVLPDPYVIHYTRELATRLSDALLSGADLRGADLSHAFGPNADLSGAKLDGAVLRSSKFPGANIDRASLVGANLEHANLTGASLVEATLIDANASDAMFRRADLAGADLSGAMLLRADLSSVNAPRINLSRADMRNASLHRAHLDRSSLNCAQLQEANLELANLVEATVEGANLGACRVYGLSAWSLVGESLQGKDLIITKDGDPVVTTDSLRTAQFIHLLLENSDLREAIDTLTSKVVLILGRFTAERKVVLDALRRELRNHNFTAVLFDFAIPADRDITETVTLLARMARFIVADLTDPASIPMELQAIAPDVAVPIRTLVHKDQEPFSMFRTLKKYHWVLPPYQYSDLDQLLSNLEAEVIAPAEAKRNELKAR